MSELQSKVRGSSSFAFEDDGTAYDPDLQKKQDEWSELLILAKDINLKTNPNDVQLYTGDTCQLSPAAMQRLAASWIDDAIHGRSIYFPINTFQNDCYRMCKSL